MNGWSVKDADAVTHHVKNAHIAVSYVNFSDGVVTRVDLQNEAGELIACFSKPMAFWQDVK